MKHYQRVLRGVLLAASTEGCVGVEPGRCLPAARPPEQACLIIRQRGAPNDACEKTFAAQFIDLLYLYVIALAASSYGYYRGQIKPRAAQEFAVHVADQRELTKCLPHRHPPRVQPVAPRREHTADVHDCPRGVAPRRHPLALKDTPVATHGRRHDAIAAPTSGGAPAHCSSFRRLPWPLYTGGSLEALAITVHERNDERRYRRCIIAPHHRCSPAETL